MSAYVVETAHIDALVTYAVANQISYTSSVGRTTISLLNADEIGQKLLDENVRSVNYRYRETDAAERYTFKHVMPLPAVNIIKACHCLDYQSCETPDWQETEAFAILQAIKEAATYKLPGYDAAPWGIREDQR
jgi:hypothetical protein